MAYPFGSFRFLVIFIFALEYLSPILVFSCVQCRKSGVDLLDGDHFYRIRLPSLRLHEHLSL
jgi:hypothetical protein